MTERFLNRREPALPKLYGIDGGAARNEEVILASRSCLGSAEIGQDQGATRILCLSPPNPSGKA